MIVTPLDKNGEGEQRILYEERTANVAHRIQAKLVA